MRIYRGLEYRIKNPDYDKQKYAKRKALISIKRKNDKVV
jgi:hypothetical protein